MSIEVESIELFPLSVSVNKEGELKSIPALDALNKPGSLPNITREAGDRRVGGAEFVNAAANVGEVAALLESMQKEIGNETHLLAPLLKEGGGR